MTMNIRHGACKSIVTVAVIHKHVNSYVSEELTVYRTATVIGVNYSSQTCIKDCNSFGDHLPSPLSAFRQFKPEHGPAISGLTLPSKRIYMRTTLV